MTEPRVPYIKRVSGRVEFDDGTSESFDIPIMPYATPDQWATMVGEVVKATHFLRPGGLSGELRATPPTACACYTWAIPDARTADWYGRQHHPACDGTGHRKDQT